MADNVKTMNKEKIYSMITDREHILENSSWKRMDDDRKLVLDKFEWKMYNEDKKTWEKVAGATHVTLPFSKLKLFKTNAIMVSSKRTLQVVGKNKSGNKLSDDEAGYIVDFCERILKMADKRLVALGQFPLKPWWVEQLNWRGAIAARIFLKVVKKGNQKKLKVELNPWDVRFFSCEHGEDDIAWGSYKTRRSEGMILLEYGKTVDKTEDIRDFWTDKVNIIFGGEESWRTNPNSFDEIPIIYKLCQSGNMLQDDDDNVQKARGESIFGIDRDVYDLGNETASMTHSMSIRAYKPAMTLASKDGVTQLAKSPWRSGTVTPLSTDNEEKLDKIPMDDIKNATSLMYQIFNQCLELSGITMTDMGELSFPQSSIVVQQMLNKRNEILIPRLNTLSEGYSELLYKAINQYIKLGEKIELGSAGDMKEFDPEKLKGTYDIICEHHAVYPEQNMADLSLANAQQAFFPDKWIYEHTFKQANPTNMLRERDIRDAKSSIPAFAMMNLAHQLVDEGQNEYAFLLAQMVNADLSKMIKGEFDPNKIGNVRSPIQNDNLTALMAGQNTGTSTVSKKQATTNQTRQLSVATGAEK